MISGLKGPLKMAYYKCKDSFEYGLVFLSLRDNAKNKKGKVVFYPQMPRPRHVLGRIFSILKFKFSNDLSDCKDARFIVNWEDTTFRTRLPELNKIASSREIININCRDISKKHVDEVFGKVFGYNTMIDPTTFKGKCVQKGDINALHDGRIVECPIQKPEEGYIYQKLIHNQSSDHSIEDIRVPVFRDGIPFVYVKNRPIDDRFGSKNTSCVITQTSQVLSTQEIAGIVEFSKRMGLDYGELDVLRDREDGRIYIVDVNNTPGGPPNALSKIKQLKALQLLSAAFIEKFVNRPEEKQQLDEIPAYTLISHVESLPEPSDFPVQKPKNNRDKSQEEKYQGAIDE